MVLAHVFFNLPLVTRLALQGWLAIPPEQFRLAAQLGFGPRDTFRVVEAPMLREVMSWYGGNQSKAALALGINRATLRKKLSQHGLL